MNQEEKNGVVCSTKDSPSFSNAIRWVSFSKYSTMTARVVISLFMAKLLAPKLFGIVEMAYTFFAFAKLMRGFSISEIIVQRNDLDHRFLSTLYWTNLGICSLATGLLLALSPVAGWMYADPLVGWVAAALSLCFLLEGMAEISSSLLAKEMNFKALAIREIAEVAVMGVTGLSLAVMGYGVWAIIAGTMLSLIVRNVALHLARPFRPTFEFDRDRFRSFFAFGSQMAGIKFLGYLKQNFDKILIGTGLGASALGIYGLARKLVALPHQSVTQIVNGPAMARFAKSQDDNEELAGLYLRSIGAISLLCFPLFALLALLADPLVSLMGPEWSAAVPLVPVLSAATAISTINTTRHRLMIATGRADTLLKSNVVRFGLSGTAVLATVWCGLQPLAWAVLAANMIGWYIENLICFRDWPELSTRRQIRCLGPALSASLLSLLVGLLANQLLDRINAPQVVQIPSMTLLMAGTFAGCIRTLKPAALNDVASIAPARFRWLIAPSISQAS